MVVPGMDAVSKRLLLVHVPRAIVCDGCKIICVQKEAPQPRFLTVSHILQTSSPHVPCSTYLPPAILLNPARCKGSGLKGA